MDNEIRMCGECEYYASWSEDYIGKCLLSDAVVDPFKRDYFPRGVGPSDPCRYDLFIEERVELTGEGIAKVLNRFPGAFSKEITEADINVEMVIDILRRL